VLAGDLRGMDLRLCSIRDDDRLPELENAGVGKVVSVLEESHCHVEVLRDGPQRVAAHDDVRELPGDSRSGANEN
jgi:hypothetical protein